MLLNLQICKSEGSRASGGTLAPKCRKLLRSTTHFSGIGTSRTYILGIGTKREHLSSAWRMYLVKGEAA